MYKEMKHWRIIIFSRKQSNSVLLRIIMMDIYAVRRKYKFNRVLHRFKRISQFFIVCCLELTIVSARAHCSHCRKNNNEKLAISLFAPSLCAAKHNLSIYNFYGRSYTERKREIALLFAANLLYLTISRQRMFNVLRKAQYNCVSRNQIWICPPRKNSAI